jgi:hypothetical protein
VSVDLTKVCSVLSSCAGSYVDVRSAFRGSASLTVSQMLSYTATRSNAGGSAWYGQVTSLQVLPKDGFDAITTSSHSAPNPVSRNVTMGRCLATPPHRHVLSLLGWQR